MLIANYSKDISNNAGHYKMGGGITNPYAVMKPSTLRNKWLGGNTNDQWVRDSINTGHNSPYVLVMGTKGWLLTSTNQSNGVASVNGNISMGINIEGQSDGTSTVAANMALLMQLAGVINGSSTASGVLNGLIQLLGTSAGAGSASGSISLLSFLSAQVNGTSTAAANLRGTLSLEGTIYVNQSEATVQQLIDGVWNAIAANYNTSGTMGEIVNNMGSVTDPWSTTLPGGYTADQAGAIVDRLETLAKQIKALTAAGL